MYGIGHDGWTECRLFVGDRTIVGRGRNKKLAHADAVAAWFIEHPVRPESLVSTEVPTTSSAAFGQEVISPPERPLAEPTRDLHGYRSVAELIKRPALLIRVDPSFVGPLPEIPVTAGFQTPPSPPLVDFRKPGQIYWWSKLYRYHVGGFRARVFGANDIEASFFPAPGASFSQYFDRNREGSIGNIPNGYNPQTLGMRNVGLVEAQITYQSAYHMLRVPFDNTTIFEPTHSSGSLGVYKTTEGIGLKVFWSADDNLRLSWLFRVPSLKVLPGPGEEEKKRESVKLDHRGRPIHVDFPQDVAVLPESGVGVSFSDAFGEEVSSGGRPAAGEMKYDDNSEQPIDFSALALRPQFVSTHDWTTGDPDQHLIASFPLPWGLIGSDLARIPFRSFVYWRGKMRVKIQIQSQMFQQGLLIVYFAPALYGTDVQDIVGTPTAQTAGMHAFLPAGSTRNLIMDIPFVSPLSRLRWDRRGEELNNIGTLQIRVFNVLRTGSAATGGGLTAKVSVFGSFPESDFQVLRPFGAADEDDVVVQPEGGAVSALNLLRTVDYRVSAGPRFARVSLAGSADALFAPGPVLDRPNYGANPLQFVRKALPDIATLSNVDQMTVLDAYPDQQTHYDPREFGTALDEMDLKYLWTKFTFLNRVGWADTDVPGTILYTGTLTPCPASLDVAVGDSFTPTLVEFSTLPFRLWRGSLRLQITFVASRIITGRVAVCTHYGGDGLGADLNEAMSQYAHIIDLAADNMTHVVEFPWRSAREMLYVPTAGVANEGESHSMGSFTIRVVNPLKSMESASSIVEFNLFWSAGDDYCVSFLGSQTLSFVV